VLIRFLAASAVVAAAVGFISPPASAQAPVGVPSTFWGTVAVDGASVPAGTEVRGFIDGRDCTQTGENYRTVAVASGVSSYAIEVVHESQVPGCGAEGRMVTFTVGGVPAAQSVPWVFGPTRIDLTVGAGQALPLPTATGTPVVSTATPTPAGATTPHTGTPPVDNVDPRELFGGSSPSATPGVPASGSSDGGSTLSRKAIAVMALVVIGAGAGLLLARRRLG